MTEQIKFALISVLAVFLVTSGWVARTWYDDSVELAIERVKDEVSIVNAESISKMKVENKTVYAKTVEKVTTNTVYRDCVADDAMMTLTNKVLEWK